MIRVRPSSELRALETARGRCYNRSDKDYKNYGKRGIKVCDRWLSSPELFIVDMGPKPTKAHSLDRRDPNGDYTPENCRWATSAEQAQNRRNAKLNPVAVVLMRYMHRRGANYAQLSRAFGVALRTAKFAVLGFIWKNALDVTERAKQPPIGGSVAGVLSPLPGCCLAPSGTSISRNFSRWNRTALYVNGWARRMPWTYLVYWVQDIGCPSHPNPNEGHTP